MAVPEPRRISRAGTSSAAAIARLIRELALEQGERSPVTARYVRRYLGATGCRVLLARESNRVVGMISYSLRPGLYHAARSCVIEDLIVTKGARNGGIGGSLLREVIRIARREKCAEISVTTGKRNWAAARLYKRLGLRDESLYLEKHFP